MHTNDWGLSCRHCTTSANAPRFKLGFQGERGEKHYPPHLEIEPKHLDISLVFDIEHKAADGVVVTTVEARRAGPRELKLNAVDFAKVEVTDADGKALTWAYDGKFLTVRWQDPFAAKEARRLRVSYRVEGPVSGLFFSQPDAAYPNAPRCVYTDHETERARHWLPCIDLPNVRTTLAFHIRAPEAYTILANGSSKGEERHGDGTKTAHWALTQVCPSYLICITAGDFVRADDGTFQNQSGHNPSGELPVAFFAADHAYTPEILKLSFDRTKGMLAWITKKLDYAFPYPKYYQVALPFFGGAMENISLVTWTERAMLDKTLASEQANSVDHINLHEMAHSYFGDLITVRDFANAWLKESWAEYMVLSWVEDVQGEDERRFAFYNYAQSYFAEAEDKYMRPIVTREYQSSWQMYDQHLYPGGACRLHTLRCELGDDTFWGAVRDYVKTYAGQVVETDEFRRMLEKHSGRSLGQFFDQWFFAPGYPSLKVGFSYDEEKKQGTFEIEQTQVDEKAGVPVFQFSCELGWTIDGIDTVVPIKVDRQKQFYSVAMAKEPQIVRFDPHGKVLHKLDFNPGDAKLRAQLRGAKDIEGRILAAKALASSGKRANIEALVEAYGSEGFYGVRGEMAQALADAGVEAAIEALAKLVAREQDPRVMHVVFKAAGSYRDKRIARALEKRLAGGLPYTAHRMALESLGAQRENAPWQLLVDATRNEGFNGIVQAGALRAISLTQRDEAVGVLLEHTVYGMTSNRVRPAAVLALAEIARLKDKPVRSRVNERLIDLLRDPAPTVRWAAASALKTMDAQEALPALEAYGHTLAEQERVQLKIAVIAPLQKTGAPKAAALERQLEELREKYRKLEDRLARLESSKD